MAETEGVIATLVNMIPTNPIEALTTGAILQIIFFAIFLGIGITLVGEKALPVQRFFEGLAAKYVQNYRNCDESRSVFWHFGLLVPIIGTYGPSILLPLMKVIVAMTVAVVVHVVIVYSFAVKTFGKMNPLQFFKGIFPAASVAFVRVVVQGLYLLQ